MSKCKSLICDVCQQHVEDDEGALFIRAKRRWYCWHESGFKREQLCVCADCQDRLLDLMLSMIELDETEAEDDEDDEALPVVQGFQAKEETP